MALTSGAANVLQWSVQRDAIPRGGANRLKPAPVQIGRLQLAPMKLESLVIGDQLCPGEYVPEPCTHRPSSHESREYLKSPSKGPTVRPVIGTKS